MWPGIVGKGTDSEPAIDLDTMLSMTAAAEVNGTKFDGVDLFLSLPHTDIDSRDDDLKELADKLVAHNLVAGSLVAPVWPPTGGDAARAFARICGPVRWTAGRIDPHHAVLSNAERAEFLANGAGLANLGEKIAALFG